MPWRRESAWCSPLWPLCREALWSSPAAALGYAWFNNDGSGKDWQRIDLLAHHNSCQEKDIIPNPASGTSAYTELLRPDDSHVLCIYDRLARGWSAIPKGSQETNSVWVVRMTVKSMK